MSEPTLRYLPITKVQADECTKLNQMVAQAMANVSLYTAAILHGHGITVPHDVIRVVPKDGGYQLVVTEHVEKQAIGK